MQLAWFSRFGDSFRLRSARYAELVLPRIAKSHQLTLFYDDFDAVPATSLAARIGCQAFHYHQSGYQLQSESICVYALESDSTVRFVERAARVRPGAMVLFDTNFNELYFSEFSHSTGRKDVDELATALFGSDLPAFGDYHVRGWPRGAFDQLYRGVPQSSMRKIEVGASNNTAGSFIREPFYSFSRVTATHRLVMTDSSERWYERFSGSSQLPLKVIDISPSAADKVRSLQELESMISAAAYVAYLPQSEEAGLPVGILEAIALNIPVVTWQSRWTQSLPPQSCIAIGRGATERREVLAVLDVLSREKSTPGHANYLSVWHHVDRCSEDLNAALLQCSFLQASSATPIEYRAARNALLESLYAQLTTVSPGVVTTEEVKAVLASLSWESE